MVTSIYKHPHDGDSGTYAFLLSSSSSASSFPTQNLALTSFTSSSAVAAFPNTQLRSRSCYETPVFEPRLGVFTIFWSISLLQRQKAVPRRAEQHIVDQCTVVILPKDATPPVCPKLDSLVGLNPRTTRGGTMLRFAPLIHSIAVNDEALFQSYTRNSEKLPKALLSVMTRFATRAVARFLSILCFVIVQNSLKRPTTR